ncbi:GDSL-type esterase/lipase family protein [Spirosoma fluviale]|uniref:Lysophospholipase L1 n=1 Tax=Spirosoma fluviale TaxID=1597977 RepID=A0A286GHP9_9BACT|nr:GDSL-type esterase/lipase family protein [Spirosoma fluviale]SOD94736.1 Lysophospholipase L1 [Spirosoma fluviale]
MKRSLPYLLLVVPYLLLPAVVQGQSKVRIACVGNSITFGHGLPNRTQNSYPGQLQKLLGDRYEVMNFGVSSKTVIRSVDNAYTTTSAYREALASKPDLVFIKLGTNDSRLPYRLKIDEFIPDYRQLIQSFKSLPTHPRIVLLLPVASFLTDTTRQTEQAISSLIIPRIRQVAFEEKCALIDLHALTIDHPDYFPDKLHPDSLGASVIARRLHEAVTSEEVKGFDFFAAIPQPASISSFYGYDCADFTLAGRACKVVKPRFAANGLPWIWRARFWGHEPQTDIALLDRGFHLVYCDVAELFGNAQAVAAWNTFYRFATKAGLAPKVALEGLSRGGVYSYNWAAENPEKVACIYADAPVLDLKSWPGGKGKGKGSPADWVIFKNDYGLISEEQALAFAGNPMDKVAEIVKGGYPMLHVVGDADDVVPVDENTAPFEQKVKALGGQIQVIHKPGIGHHPHSLPNPAPIVDFILKATKP